MNKKEMIGLDRTCKPVYVGDTIQDAEGVKYTITERGTAVGPGGKEVQYHTIKGPELCSDEPKQEAPAAPVKKEEKIFPKRRGGKENKSGLVSLGSLARRLQVKQAGIARTLRAGGIEVVKGKNGYGIRVADVEKAEQLLAPLSAVIKPQSAKKVAEVKREVQKQPEGPAVDFGAIEDVVGVDTAILLPSEKNPADLAEYDTDMLFGELKRRHVWPAIATTDTTHVFTKKDADLMLDDMDLAEMLRARGFEVTATKTVVVSL